MGISQSRLEQKSTGKPAAEEQGSIPSTPILTPKVFKDNIEKGFDPRSPSRHIARTPIELLFAAADKLKTLTIETGDSDNNVAVETPLKRHLILGIDPRSPTLELQRTPIVVNNSPEKRVPARIRNKNLDKVKNSALLNSPKVVPPKLLDSTPVTPKTTLDAYKRKSFVLLETNVDFTETDLDAVIQRKYLDKSLENLSTSQEASYCEIDDPRSPAIDFLRTPLQVCKPADTVVDNLVSETVEEHLVQNVVSDNVTDKEDSVNINESTSTELANTVLVKSKENNEDTSEEDIELTQITCNDEDKEIINDDVEQLTNQIECEAEIDQTPASPKAVHSIPKSAPVSPPNIVNVTPKQHKSAPVTPPVIDLTADVKELDKKLTNLIYEDEVDQVICPRIVKVKEPQNRTPLGLRNGLDNNKMPLQKLKVSDKPRKAENVISKIPVFKEKKIKVQCENTPPRGMRGIKPKKSQWDSKDDTLVI